MKATMNNPTTVPCLHGILVGPARIEHGSPAEYRLAKKPDGTLTLQGAYYWEQGDDYGHEWRDIETVEIP